MHVESRMSVKRELPVTPSRSLSGAWQADAILETPILTSGQ